MLYEVITRAISKETVFIGEVSLVGDIREVFQLDQRLKEAASQQITKALVPKKPLEKTAIKCYEIDEVNKLLEWF